MENLDEKIVEQTTNEVEQTSVSQEEQTVNVNFKSIIKWGLVALGFIFLIVGINYLIQDLHYLDNPMEFTEERYVGGDAYNYIISAARSTAIMVKSLIWVVLGCSSIIVSRTIHTTKE